jgi:hypothetical protein
VRRMGRLTKTEMCRRYEKYIGALRVS